MSVKEGAEVVVAGKERSTGGLLAKREREIYICISPCTYVYVYIYIYMCMYIHKYMCCK